MGDDHRTLSQTVIQKSFHRHGKIDHILKMVVYKV